MVCCFRGFNLNYFSWRFCTSFFFFVVSFVSTLCLSSCFASGWISYFQHSHTLQFTHTVLASKNGLSSLEPNMCLNICQFVYVSQSFVYYPVRLGSIDVMCVGVFDVSVFCLVSFFIFLFFCWWMELNMVLNKKSYVAGFFSFIFTIQSFYADYDFLMDLTFNILFFKRLV